MRPPTWVDSSSRIIPHTRRHAVSVIAHGSGRASWLDPAIVGRSVLLNGQTFTIVGVSANGFTGTNVALPADMWIPLAMQREVGRSLLTQSINWLDNWSGDFAPAMRRELAAEALNRDFQGRASELPSQTSPRLLVLVPADKGSSPARGEQRSAPLTHLCAERIRVSTCVYQRRVPRRRAIGGARREKWRYGSPLAPGVHGSSASF